MNYVFVQTSSFAAKARKFGLSVEDIRRIELTICENAKTAPVIAGTNGLRKMRFAPEATGGGKSGGIRVCYVVIEEAAYVYFITFFAKNEKDNIDPSERHAIAALIVRLKKSHS